MPSVVGQARPLRWLLVAPFSTNPSGRVTTASGERFARVMAKVGPHADVELPTGLGSAIRGTVTLAFERPRDFRMAEVAKRVEPLAKLTAIADELRRGTAPSAALDKVRAVVGEGPLVTALVGLDEPAPVEPPASAEPPSPAEPAPVEPAAAAAEPSEPSESSESTGGSALDAIFAKAQVSPPPAADPSAAAKSGLDAFIGAMRKGGGGPTTRSSSDKSLAKRMESLLREAVDAATRDLMTAPAVARLEDAWRGFREVVAAAPGADDLAIDIADAWIDGIAEVVAARLALPPMERPDAVFVAESLSDPAALTALATLAAAHQVPVVAEVPATVAGGQLEGHADLPPVPDDWTELRTAEVSRWLCVCANRMVAANEDAADGPRIVFASAVWGVAAMLSASVNQTAGPGQIFGRAGALVGPASHLGDGGETIATEQPVSIDRQRALAERGVLVLGSERGSDRLRLAAAPMVGAGPSGTSLPGQILAGRAARLTRAIRDELPPHATAQELTARIQEASTNFLPRVPAGSVALEVKTDDQGQVGVGGSIGPNLAGASFSFSSDL